MEHLAIGVGVVLFIYGMYTLFLWYSFNVISAALTDVYTSLSFRPMLVESACVHIVTESGERVRQIIQSQLFSIFCSLTVSGHNSRWLVRRHVSEIEWQCYLGHILLSCLESQGLIRFEDEDLDPVELNRYELEISRLPSELSRYFLSWQLAHALGGVHWVMGTGNFVELTPTMRIRKVRKLPKGPPMRKQTFEMQPQFAF